MYSFYWKVVAEDEYEAMVEGPVWHFTVSSNNPEPIPTPTPTPTPTETTDTVNTVDRANSLETSTPDTTSTSNIATTDAEIIETSTYTAAA